RWYFPLPRRQYSSAFHVPSAIDERPASESGHTAPLHEAPGTSRFTFVTPVTRTQISAEWEDFRDERWQREATRQIETPFDAERFVERVGFAACLTDARRPGPSLYVAVCGRRDAIMPRNVQKDPEASHTWRLKDEVVRRGKVYYGKLARARTLFI